MRFGKSAQEVEKEAPRAGGSGGFMKYMRDGDNYMHIGDEPDQWVYYWEHFNPDGFPYPCTNERDTCPGCNSKNEKEAKASRKIAFNAHDGEYTNVWKVPKSVADKLKNRFERIGTITDRPYIVTRLKDGNSYDFDLEGQDKCQVPDSLKEHWRDPEELLAQAFEDAHGDSQLVQSNATESKKVTELRSRINRIDAERKMNDEPPPPSKPEAEQYTPAEGVGERVVSESDLRSMDAESLRILCEEEGFGQPPRTMKKSDTIVDWMLSQ